MTDPDLTDRFDFVVDHDAEFADIDEALIDFAIAFIRGEDSE